MATTPERKGILKRPVQAPRPFFSFTRDMLSISRLLGPGGQPGGATPGVPDTGERAVLKRAHFIVPEMRVVYPISSANAPSSAAQSEAKLEIDEAERLRRESEYQQAWTAARVEALYKDICKLRDERVDPTISAQIHANVGAPRVLDLSRTKLSFDAASALADLLALDWGLQRLILSECDLDDLSLKPILHALLIPDSLPYLALANNRRLRASAYKMISSYLAKTYALEFIDLSLNVLDKRSVESILAILPPAPPQPPPPPPARISRTPSMISLETPSPSVQFTNPFDKDRPTIDTNVTIPRRVKDPARYPESPGAGPSSPRGSLLGSPRGSFSNAPGSPRMSVSSLTSVSETPRVGSPIDREKNGSGLGSTGNNWSGVGSFKKKKRTKRSLVGIRLDESHAIRTSQIQTVSLRSNKIGQAGAVALALMMKDYPDQTQLSISGPSGPPASGQGLAPPMGLGLSLTPTPESSSRSTPQGSPRPSTTSLAGSDSTRPNLQSHSSLTTVSTFKERDIVRGPPSPPEVTAGLEDVKAALENGTKAQNGHVKAPPVVAPKPKGLQARLAGAVATGTSPGPILTQLPQPQPFQTQSQPLQPQSEPAPLTQSPLPISPPNTKPLAPPPRHPAVHQPAPAPGTNYAAYVPRVRRAAGAPASTPPPKPPAPIPTTGQIPVPYVARQTPLSVRLQNAARAAAPSPPPSRPSTAGAQPGTKPAVTMITSSLSGGVTTRLPNVPSNTNSAPASATGPSVAGGSGLGGGTSAALMDIVRSMEGVPKLGCLVVLDLRGNDLRGGVSYIAQVLKRNRTLRSLNLSENKVEVQGLMVLAEALKYNSTLTSLDLSNNPCSSPSLEGIHVLRNALTLNTTLRHLSLAATSLTSQGAIALAEFLPDFPALQHLDLTANSLDVAGVMALSVGIKVNYTMRCLDLSIMPGEEDMARLCREILKICVRNTERAQAAEEARAGKVAEGVPTPILENGPSAVWDPIEHSALAREAHVNINATTAAGVDPAGRIGVWKMTPNEVLVAARSCADEFRNVGGGEDLVRRAREIRTVLVEMIRVEKDETLLSEMLVLNDGLAPIVGDLPTPVAVEREQSIRKEMGLGLSIGGDEAKSGGPGVAEAAEGEVEAEDGDEDGGETSPAENLSRSWVAEEGEILRKGRVLLSPNELESGTDSEALRQELLEAQVDRAPARIIEQEEDPAPIIPEPEEVEGDEERVR
ncbi:protein phosphatase 1 regulatory subunit 37 [Ceratobasidium sp. AG-Ba]|nr:protein phosphatase 1 regulatory subunit 37 [Ceratobasidium sp. AG-Ba]